MKKLKKVWGKVDLQGFLSNFGTRWFSSVFRCLSWPHWCTWPGPERARQTLYQPSVISWENLEPWQLYEAIYETWALSIVALLYHTHEHIKRIMCSTNLHSFQSLLELLFLWSVNWVTQKFLWSRIIVINVVVTNVTSTNNLRHKISTNKQCAFLKCTSQ